MILDKDLSNENKVEWVRCFDKASRALLNVPEDQIGDMLLIKASGGLDEYQEMLVIGVGDIGACICQDVLGLCIRSRYLKAFSKETGSLWEEQLYLNNSLNMHYLVVGDYDEVMNFMGNKDFCDWFEHGQSTWVMATYNNKHDDISRAYELSTPPLLVPIESNPDSLTNGMAILTRGIFELRNMLYNAPVHTNSIDQHTVLSKENAGTGFLICHQYEPDESVFDVLNHLKKDMQTYREVGIITGELSGILVSIGGNELTAFYWAKIENLLVEELGKEGMHWHSGMPAEIVKEDTTLQIVIWGV